MPLGEESLRVAIAGATPLHGKDLKAWIEQSGFPAGEVRLFDEELAVGTLTEFAGEPAVIQRIDSSSFDKTRFVFFTGSPAFAAKHAAAAQKAGATVIDLSGGLSGLPAARPWIPALDALLPPPSAANSAPSSAPGSAPGSADDLAHKQTTIYLSPSTPVILACSLAAACAPFNLSRLVITFFQPVSERGQAGVEELESQTVKLLSFQPLPQEVFDTQVAFNLLDRWGPASHQRLSDVRAALARDVQAYLAGRLPMPAMTLVQAPVFYAHAFAAYAEFAQPVETDALTTRIEAAGCKATASKATGDDLAPSNLNIAGEEKPWIARPEPDPASDRGFWLWGAADNMRVASANALRIAERLLVS
jgi:aspartate-semialdehyde dehydrogenase